MAFFPRRRWIRTLKGNRNCQLSGLGLALALTLTLTLPRAAEGARRPPDWTALADLVGRQLAAANVPAAALVVVEGRQVPVLRAFGEATPQTPFRVGSITKTFTALAALTTAHEKGVPLDTPLRQLIAPELWRNRYATDAPVRLGQLLELAAGFRDLDRAEWDSASPIARRDAFRLAPASHVTLWQPGLASSYSNLIPAYTAQTVEALTGKPFATVLAREVLAPLGMPGATLEPRSDLPGGYKADGATPIPYWHMAYPAFGALNVSTDEFAEFLLRLVNDDLPAPIAKARDARGVALYEANATSAAQAGLRIGYGVGMYSEIRQGRVFFGHGGDADGYRSRYAVLPEAERAYYLVINVDNPGLLTRLSNQIERMLTHGLPKIRAERVPLDEEARGALLAAYGRTYYPATRRFAGAEWHNCQAGTAELYLHQDRLTWRNAAGRKIRLTHSGDGLFRRSNDPVPTLAFVERLGKRYLLGELGNWRRLEPGQDCRGRLIAAAE
ncbi:MAG: serine hydrolase domain-containing protein [Pseudomonadota bacterium]